MKIFISYSRKDVDFARMLAADLNRSGLDVWLDVEDIKPGFKWSRAIQQGLDATQTMILIITPESMDSTNVEDEWQYFLDEHKEIIPVLLRPAKIQFQIKRLQYIDFHQQPYQTALNQLCKYLNAKDGSSSATDSPQIRSRATVVSTVDILPKPFAWIDIPAGKVTLTPDEADKKESYLKKATSFDLLKFAIAKYPLTNGQFAKFIDAQGYSQRQWWTDAGWQVKEQNKWIEPRYWSDSKWTQPDYPVVGVSWFEAIAFCQWLSEQTGGAIRLPTEQEWQRAAQGDRNWAYPWGDKFDKNRCNFNTQSTTPVTQYEGEGDSQFGVVDMSGNVWEWCVTDYESGGQDINKNANTRVLRGGSWDNNLGGNLRTDYRYGFNPDDRNDNGGFRLSRS